MLQRALIHISLVLLFALTQMGVATHEISHYTDSQKQHQQDKKHQNSQCEQCLVLSHAANAPLAYSFNFVSSSTSQNFFDDLIVNTRSRTTTSYSARAPPSHSQT